jgi:hypothetical protein
MTNNIHPVGNMSGAIRKTDDFRYPFLAHVRDGDEKVFAIFSCRSEEEANARIKDVIQGLSNPLQPARQI